jgi:hypothetical protein
MRIDTSMVIQSVLDSGEDLLWSGQPRQGIFFRKADIFLVPFSLVWGGFAIFWEYMTIHMGTPLPFGLFGIPFVLMGLYLIVGRFFVDAMIRKKTFYGVTSERVIILSGLLARNLESLNIRSMNDLSLSFNRRDSGTIGFGPGSQAAAFFSGLPMPGRGKALGARFEQIPHVQQVYNLIRDAQEEAVRRS